MSALGKQGRGPNAPWAGCPGFRHVDVPEGHPEGGVRAQGTLYVQSCLPLRPTCLMTTRIYHQVSSGGNPLSVFAWFPESVSVLCRKHSPSRRTSYVFEKCGAM